MSLAYATGMNSYYFYALQKARINLGLVILLGDAITLIVYGWFAVWSHANKNMGHMIYILRTLLKILNFGQK